MGKAASQALLRVRSVQGVAGGDEVQVGQVDDLHAAPPECTSLLMMTLR